MVSIAAKPAVFVRTVSTRRAGWLLIASMLAFVVVLLYIIIGGMDVDGEARTAARAEGSTIHTLSAEAQARIAGRHATYWIISGVLALVPFALFALGVRELRESMRASDTANLTTAAWWAAAAAMTFWSAIGALTLGLLADPDNLPPLVSSVDRLLVPLTTGVAVLGLVATLCAGLAFRRASIAPRMAVAVIIISGVLLVAAVVEPIATRGDTPPAPIVPMLPALLLGIALLRTRSAAAA
jgi:hypothetical protein